MLIVPRKSHRPKLAASAPKGGEGPRRPSSPRSGARGGAPPSSIPAGTSWRVPSSVMGLVRGLHAGRVRLHHVVARGLGVGVLVGPAVHGRDLARPVAVGRWRGGGPLQPVGVPG